MAVNFTLLCYKPVFDTFARLIVVYPLASQPAVGSYTARGIYDTNATDIMTEDAAIYSDTKTVCDIIEQEFSVLPQQGDRIAIPAYQGLPDLGLFEVLDADSNGGGKTELALRAVVTAAP